MAGIMLEANVSKNKIADFEEEYRRKTGRFPRRGDFYTIYESKWGVECRVYFDSDVARVLLEALGYHVERIEKRTRWGIYNYRVNNNSLFWKLVNKGLRLGHNRV